tara:strand:- start:41879 stop:42037 length:159 start_codon:yes stop_codon:yes gene_type:complete
MCCDGTGYYENEIDGECPTCGGPTVDGDAYESCGYSPLDCDTCGCRPCDLSC